MMVHYNESMDRAMLPLNNMIICGQMCSLKFVGASLSLLPSLGNSAEDARVSHRVIESKGYIKCDRMGKH